MGGGGGGGVLDQHLGISLRFETLTLFCITRSRVLARLASLAQIGGLARRLCFGEKIVKSYFVVCGEGRDTSTPKNARVADLQLQNSWLFFSKSA